jgi:NitT/TauT family transport system permease protein
MIGEWFGAPRGLGVLLQSAMYNYQIPLLWSAALLAAVMSTLAYGLAAIVEHLASVRFPRPTHLADIGLVAARGDQSDDRRGRIRSAIGSAMGLAAIVVVWQLWLWVAGIDPIVMPSPMLVAEAFVTDSATIAAGTIHTATVAVFGLTIGLVCGFLLAVFGQFSEVLSGLIVPATVLARSIPVVALIPVIARLLSFNDLTVVGVAVVITFFPFFGLASSGLRALPPGATDVFRLHSASRRMEMLHLRIPSSVPHLLTALRIAAPLSVLGALAAEWLIGSAGLGFLFGRSKTHFATGEAWSAIIVAMVLSVAAFAIAAAVERRGRERWT